MFRKYYLLIALPLLVSSQACGLFSKSNEFVTVATEVGEATGPAATKSIGPEGGSIASPDGRMTLKIPPNVVPAAINFSIQPITNKAEGGLGNAYRLEPPAQKFSAPIELTLTYNDNDLKGTFPEAFAVAYQDEQRSWHAQAAAKLDTKAKTLTISITHFSDWSWVTSRRISPAETTLHVGETQFISLIKCEEPGFVSGLMNRVFRRPLKCVPGSSAAFDKAVWRLEGAGAMTGDADRNHDIGGNSVEYTAPSRKPSPNVVYVLLDYEASQVEDNRLFTVRGSYSSKITILDKGYRASGQAGPVTYSGYVCDLSSQFTIIGKHPLMDFVFQFYPNDATSGTMKYVWTYKAITATGTGSYSVSGIETDKPRILMHTDSTASIPQKTTSGGGDTTIDLTPRTTGECEGN